MTPEQIRQHYKPPQLTPRSPLNEFCWTLHPKSKSYPRKVMHVTYEAVHRRFVGRWKIKRSPSDKLSQPQGSLPFGFIDAIKEMLPAEDLAACVAASIRHMQMAGDDRPF
jgi:hypothetical protein